MKRISWILLVSLLCISFNNADEVKWYGWDEAQALAEASDKPIMVFVYATWCHLSKRMDTKVFTNEEVAAMLNENFIPVKLDVEFTGELKKDGNTFTIEELLAELTDNQLRGIPSYLFISKTSGKKVRLEGGLKDPEEMKALLKEFN
jgi:thiol:disulfide interchange protein